MIDTSDRLVSDQMPPTTRASMDSAVAALQAHKGDWAQMSLPLKLDILRQLIAGCGAIAEQWVARSLEGKRASGDSYSAALEWISGPAVILRYLQCLRRALREIQRDGAPSIRGPIRERADGQVVATFYPRSLYERMVTPGVTAEVWMEPGVSARELEETQALAYRSGDSRGGVVLVLGAGNVSAIPVNDALSKLFVENHVVLLKMNPINAYLGPMIEKGLHALVEGGFLRVVYGGAAEGSYLCQHAGVDEIHMTGSERTYEAIVWGSGEDRETRKQRLRPLVDKRVTAELGNVAPAIIVPGPWTAADLDYQAEHLASHLADSGSYSCSRSRVIVQHAGWPQREALLERLGRVLDLAPLPAAYYPGASDLHERFVSAHPDASQFGRWDEERIPWTVISGLDAADADEICFATESFCPVIAEAVIAAPSTPEFIDRAVAFANQNLWGTLSATILVHPGSLADPAIAAAVERAISDLRYGAVVVNGIPGMVWVMASPPWGSYPGNDISDIQSGTGFVHNALMFSRPQKVVVRGPFRMRPKPMWFHSRAQAYKAVAKKVAQYEMNPSWPRLLGIIGAALRR